MIRIVERQAYKPKGLGFILGSTLLVSIVSLVANRVDNDTMKSI